MGIIKKAVEKATEDIIVGVADGVSNAVKTGLINGAVAVVNGVSAVANSKVVKGATDGLSKGAQAIEGAIEHHHETKEARHEEKEQQYIAEKSADKCLIINKEQAKNGTFNVYDADQNIRYSVKGKLSDKRGVLNFELIDAEQNPVGRVLSQHSKGLAYENDSKAYDYAIELKGQQVALIRREKVNNKDEYAIDPFGWHIEGKVLKWDFTIMDRKNDIVHISKRRGYDTETYIMDFYTPGQELIGLFIVLTLIGIK